MPACSRLLGIELESPRTVEVLTAPSERAWQKKYDGNILIVIPDTSKPRRDEGASWASRR